VLAALGAFGATALPRWILDVGIQTTFESRPDLPDRVQDHFERASLTDVTAFQHHGRGAQRGNTIQRRSEQKRLVSYATPTAAQRPLSL